MFIGVAREAYYQSYLSVLTETSLPVSTAVTILFVPSASDSPLLESDRYTQVHRWCANVSLAIRSRALHRIPVRLANVQPLPGLFLPRLSPSCKVISSAPIFTGSVQPRCAAWRDQRPWSHAHCVCHSVGGYEYDAQCRSSLTNR